VDFCQESLFEAGIKSADFWNTENATSFNGVYPGRQEMSSASFSESASKCDVKVGNGIGLFRCPNVFEPHVFCFFL